MAKKFLDPSPHWHAAYLLCVCLFTGDSLRTCRRLLEQHQAWAGLKSRLVACCRFGLLSGFFSLKPSSVQYTEKLLGTSSEMSAPRQRTEKRSRSVLSVSPLDANVRLLKTNPSRHSKKALEPSISCLVATAKFSESLYSVGRVGGTRVESRRRKGWASCWSTAKTSRMLRLQDESKVSTSGRRGSIELVCCKTWTLCWYLKGRRGDHMFVLFVRGRFFFLNLRSWIPIQCCCTARRKKIGRCTTPPCWHYAPRN